MQNQIIEFETLSSLTNEEAPSHIPTRWERKQALDVAKTPSRKRPLTSNSESPSNISSPTARLTADATPSSRAAKQKKFGTPGLNRQSSSDRFIPTRGALDFETANYKLLTQEASSCAGDVPNTPTSQEAHEFKRALADTLGTSDSRVLAFKKKAPAPAEDFENPHAVLYTKRQPAKPAVSTRVIPNAPEKILDAPDLLNDFYINPLDWSCANQLGVALGPSVYLWNAATGGIHELCSMEGSEYVSSIKFVQEGGGYLAVGSSDKMVGLWDVETAKCMRRLNGHSARVSCLAWNGHILTSGGRDASIIHHDVRVQNHIVGVLQGHTQEVCSLHWSPDGSALASGSNDNTVCVWDGLDASAASAQGPRLRLTHHQAAVKAMAWCPYERSVLATGGGTSDRSIKIWSTVTGVERSSIDTGSQVCSLLFNPNSKELLSSHGFSENQLSLWKFPTMTKIKDLTGHTARVLHTACSPDGSTVCSAASDETLRLWKCFGQPSVASKGDKEGGEGRPAGGVLRMSIR